MVNGYKVTCGFADNEVSALVHLELPRVTASVLFTQPLNLFTLNSRETRHTHRTALQDRTLIIFYIQLRVMEHTERGTDREFDGSFTERTEIFNLTIWMMRTCLS